MAVRSRAAVTLREKLSPPVMNRAELARRLSVSTQSVAYWLSGRARPGLKRMLEIESLLGIPMQDWAQDSDEAVPDESGPQLPASADSDDDNGAA